MCEQEHPILVVFCLQGSILYNFKSADNPEYLFFGIYIYIFFFALPMLIRRVEEQIVLIRHFPWIDPSLSPRPISRVKDILTYETLKAWSLIKDRNVHTCLHPSGSVPLIVVILVENIWMNMKHLPAFV